MDTYNKKKVHTNIEDRYVLSACNIVKNVYIQKSIYFMRNGERLTFSKQRRFGIGRGNPLLARRKIRTEEDLNIKSKRLMGV